MHGRGCTYIVLGYVDEYTSILELPRGNNITPHNAQLRLALETYLVHNLANTLTTNDHIRIVPCVLYIQSWQSYPCP